MRPYKAPLNKKITLKGEELRPEQGSVAGEARRISVHMLFYYLGFCK